MVLILFISFVQIAFDIELEAKDQNRYIDDVVSCLFIFLVYNREGGVCGRCVKHSSDSEVNEGVSAWG